MHWPAEAAGAAALVLGRTMAGRILGVLWLLAPLTDRWMSRPIERRERIGPDEREFLLEQAGMIWKYFQDQVKEEENWLPPDHVQIDPPMGADRRTSPTNIGMALLSCVAAVDLELAGWKEAAELIGHIIGSVEKLEKWKGNLYNWYSTTSGTPLQPGYVSSVDSGNLRGCLLALSDALREWGEEELSGRAAALADEMKLTPRYGRER